MAAALTDALQTAAMKPDVDPPLVLASLSKTSALFSAECRASGAESSGVQGFGEGWSGFF